VSDKTQTAIIKIAIEAVVRKGTTIEELIKNETDILFEPRSANGCVVEHKIIEIIK